MPLKFEEGSYYACTAPGIMWSDYDGPFTLQEACEFMEQLCSSHASPEIINGTCLVHFHDNQLHLVKDDNNEVLDGKLFYQKSLLPPKTLISINNEVVWERKS